MAVKSNLPRNNDKSDMVSWVIGGCYSEKKINLLVIFATVAPTIVQLGVSFSVSTLIKIYIHKK